MENSANSRIPRLGSLYQLYITDGDTGSFIRRLGEHYTLATLGRLSEAGHREVRRAATESIGLLGDYRANHLLGRRLCDDDRGVRLLAERYIQEIWLRYGTPSQRNQLQQIIRFNDASQPARAIQLAADLIRQAPSFAEAWNQRAVAYFMQREYLRSRDDCDQTLELNPYHFSAAIGMGQCCLGLNRRYLALQCYQRALRLNPNLDGIRARISLLEQSLKGK